MGAVDARVRSEFGPVLLDRAPGSAEILEKERREQDTGADGLQILAHFEVRLAYVFVLLHVQPKIQCIFCRLALKEDLNRQKR